MKTEKNQRCVFHISPWRLYLPLMIFGPLIVFFLLISLFVQSAQQGEKEALWLVAGLFALVAIFVNLLIRRTRLEVTANGVSLRQTGYMLESTWSNVGALIDTPGAESLVTIEAMTGKGCKRLAAAADIGKGLIGFYDKERLELIAQHRLIPIEAFAWHLQNGRRLRHALASLAPHLQADLERPQTKFFGADKKNKIGKVVVLSVSLMALGVGLAFCSEPIQNQIVIFSARITMPLLALWTAGHSRKAFQTKSTGLGVFRIFLALVFLAAGLAAWYVTFPLLK